MELHLKLAGWLLIALASIHVFFPRYFAWKDEIGRLSLINRQMMYVHTFFLAVGLLLMGLLCITSADELFSSILGRRICLGLGFFWVLRLFAQFFGYSSKLWRGDRFATSVHIFFIAMWSYLSWVFCAVGFG